MTLPCDLAPAYIRGITPYPPGKPLSELERELGIRSAIKLASNENPQGASPVALRAMQEALAHVSRYPDGNGFELKQTIATRLGLNQENIVLGNGSNDILELVARAFLKSGLNAIYSRHAFAVYALVTQSIGANKVEVAAKNYGHDLAAMLAAITDDTRIIFIANPNNPTGTLLNRSVLHDFLVEVPQSILVVLDEAYYEYLPVDLRADSIAWLNEFPNIVITRTFSKAYGLAGLRVGYALATSAVADLMNRVRQPFNVNSIALAGATAALQDTDYVARVVENNFDGMTQLTRGLEKLGMAYIPSYANFISFRVDQADDVYNGLLKKGVIIRPVAHYGMPEYLRVSIGLKEENDKFLQALASVLQFSAQDTH